MPSENIHRIPTEFAAPELAAVDYESTLRKVFNIADKAIPKFDLVYLGLGEDAHTASLMPSSDVVREYIKSNNSDQQLAAATWVDKLDMYRITLTPSAINHSECIIFLVEGQNKARCTRC